MLSCFPAPVSVPSFYSCLEKEVPPLYSGWGTAWRSRQSVGWLTHRFCATWRWAYFGDGVHAAGVAWHARWRRMRLRRRTAGGGGRYVRSLRFTSLIGVGALHWAVACALHAARGVVAVVWRAAAWRAAEELGGTIATEAHTPPPCLPSLALLYWLICHCMLYPVGGGAVVPSEGGDYGCERRGLAAAATRRRRRGGCGDIAFMLLRVQHSGRAAAKPPRASLSTSMRVALRRATPP